MHVSLSSMTRRALAGGSTFCLAVSLVDPGKTVLLMLPFCFAFVFRKSPCEWLDPRLMSDRGSLRHTVHKAIACEDRLRRRLRYHTSNTREMPESSTYLVSKMVPADQWLQNEMNRSPKITLPYSHMPPKNTERFLGQRFFCIQSRNEGSRSLSSKRSAYLGYSTLA